MMRLTLTRKDDYVAENERRESEEWERSDNKPRETYIECSLAFRYGKFRMGAYQGADCMLDDFPKSPTINLSLWLNE